MPDYSDRIEVHAPVDAVFAFLSDVANLPRYLPTVHGAHAHGAERVAVDGKANGHPYQSTGWLKADPATRIMSWGSDGENDYSGRMTVTGDAGRAQVECTLRFTPNAQTKAGMDENQGGPSAAMTNGLSASLKSIKHLCEGDGGKEPSSAE